MSVKIPLDYKSINTDTPPQKVESTAEEIMVMVKALEGDWLRTNTVNNKNFNGMRIHFRTSDDGSQTIGTITYLPDQAKTEFSLGEVKYKSLRGTYHTGFYIQDKLARSIADGQFVNVDIQMMPDGKEIQVFSDGGYLYSLIRIIQ